MKHGTQAELWRLAQAAFDERRPASEDEALIEFLLEFPELAQEMDEVLLVEARLEILETAAARSPGRTRYFIMGLVAAVLLVAWAPSLWRSSAGESETLPILKSGPQTSTHLGTSVPLVARALPSIDSFELAIETQRLQESRVRPAILPRTPLPKIISITSTRTRIAPRGANTTY